VRPLTSSRLVAVFAAAVAWLPCIDVRADTPTAPTPEAVAFFDEARKLMAAGDYQGAIPKLEQSVKATRTVGALLNLGRCYEEIGRAASAWATYRAGASLARELHDAREADANGFADRVRTRVAYVTIDARAIEGVHGAELTLDGGPAAGNEALPVDPGAHVVEAAAPGKISESVKIDVRGDGDRATVKLDPLMDLPFMRPRPPTRAPETPPPASPRRTMGFVVGGVGVGATAIGLATGLMAIAKHSQATSACPTYPDHCPSSGVADGPNRDSQTFATISTVGFVAGGALLATGALLVITAPVEASRTGAVRVAPIVGWGVVGASAGIAW
jgi:hypothetical protein